jgi:FkbM family methyltransferase
MEDQYKLGDYTLSREQMELALYFGYTASDLGIFKNFKDVSAKPEKGFVVDIMGIRTRISSLVEAHRTLAGQLLGYPIPCDYHSEAIEWIGLAKGVMDAREKFVAMELGAGIGTWVISGAVMARLRNIKNIRLTAVEADPYHFRCMQQHFKDNGFNPNKHTLLEAVVGAEAGIAYWPMLANSSDDWGLRPIFEKDNVLDSGQGDALSISDYRGFKFDSMRKVTVLAVTELLRREPQWDIVHIDVQGDETTICRAAIADLGSRVKRMIIATHSRKHDGDIFELFAGAGWILEHEKPTRFTFWPKHASLEAMTTHDGTQVWRNLALLD